MEGFIIVKIIDDREAGILAVREAISQNKKSDDFEVTTKHYTQALRIIPPPIQDLGKYVRN